AAISERLGLLPYGTRFAGESSTMRILVTTVLVVALTALVSSQSPSEFRVVYYPDPAVALPMEDGILELQRDFFRFRPNSSRPPWVVDLARVESITVEPFVGPFRTVTSIVIESTEDNR